MKPNLVWSFFAVALLGTGGCYHYVPEGTGPLTRGTPIRVHLARPASFELPDLTAHNIGRMEAEVVRDDNGSLVVSARWLEAVTGSGYSGQNWTFDLARDDITRVERRTLSAWKTAVVVVGGFLATYVGFDALRGSDAGGGTGGTGGNPR